MNAVGSPAVPQNREKHLTNPLSHHPHFQRAVALCRHLNPTPPRGLPLQIYLNDAQRQATKDACTVAGLTILIVNESAEADISYDLKELPPQHCIPTEILVTIAARSITIKNETSPHLRHSSSQEIIYSTPGHFPWRKRLPPDHIQIEPNTPHLKRSYQVFHDANDEIDNSSYLSPPRRPFSLVDRQNERHTPPPPS
ncbi:hypothetical protein FS837_003559 [Tulasnella sp. UAMH 9824]|nr:hypothetical protein FS837_003559 [Tulasnella sp. UAMH 9824]